MKSLLIGFLIFLSLNLNAQLSIEKLNTEYGPSFCQSTYYHFNNANHRYFIDLNEIAPFSNSNWAKHITVVDEKNESVKHVTKIFTASQNNPRNIEGPDNPYLILQAPKSFCIYKADGNKGVLKLDSIPLISSSYSFRNDTISFYSWRSNNDRNLKLYNYSIQSKSLSILDSFRVVGYPSLKIFSFGNSQIVSKSDGIYMYTGRKSILLHKAEISGVGNESKIIDGKIYLSYYTENEPAALLVSDGTKSGTTIVSLADYIPSVGQGRMNLTINSENVTMAVSTYQNSSYRMSYFLYDAGSKKFNRIAGTLKSEFEARLFSLGNNQFLLAEYSSSKIDGYYFKLKIFEEGKNDTSSIQLPTFDDSLVVTNTFLHLFAGDNLCYLALENPYTSKLRYRQFLQINLRTRKTQIVPNATLIARRDTIYNSDSSSFEIKREYYNAVGREFMIGDAFYFMANEWDMDSFALYKVIDKTATKTTKLLNSNAVELYPNPSTGNFFIMSTAKFSEVEVFNIAGKKVANYEVTNQSFRAENLTAGTYFIRLKDGAEIFHSTLIVQ